MTTRSGCKRRPDPLTPGQQKLLAQLEAGALLWQDFETKGYRLEIEGEEVKVPPPTGRGIFDKGYVTAGRWQPSATGQRRLLTLKAKRGAA